jgi:hypothetical protein
MPSYLNEPGYRERPGKLKTTDYYEPCKDFVRLSAALENKDWSEALAICARVIHESSNEDSHGWAGLGIGKDRCSKAPTDVKEAVEMANAHAAKRAKAESFALEKKYEIDKKKDKAESKK